jgi:cytochrome c-type biogenesis protein CcmE
MQLTRTGLTALAVLGVIGCRPAPIEGTVYGTRPTLTDTTLVSTILKSPTTYMGKRVLVAGLVVQVCEERGCWLQLASDRPSETLKIKVEDGVIVFPMSARGKQAVVEGVIEQVVLTADAARAQAQEHAKEMKQPFDSTKVFEPITSVQIRGIGAIISK